MDLISRQAAIDALNKIKIYRPLDSDRYVISDCLNKIANLPAIQPKRGKYKAIVCDGVDLLACSECGYTGAFWTYNYCPNCGADMRGGNDE